MTHTYQPIDLASYKEAFPIYVDLHGTIGDWSIYHWDGILMQAVTQRSDGVVIRCQDINEELLAQTDLSTPDPVWREEFPSLQAMIESDIAMLAEYEA